MNKLQALKTTIEKIESGEYNYNWTDEDNCNCGLIAKTLIGRNSVSSAGLHKYPSDGGYGAVWTKASHCMTTDLPLPEVFKKLKDAGFTRHDIIELEYLANETICNNLGWRRQQSGTGPYFFSIEGINLKYNIKDNLLKYLKEWVRILEYNKSSIKVVTKYVSIPTSITNQTLILS